MNQTISESDGFGRLLRSQQFTGSYAGGPDWYAVDYAESTYTYDELDNLTAMNGPDAGGNPFVHAAIAYDALGRKIYMDDPNMGIWTYGYDYVGNLNSQTDARGCITTLDYDVLNRLTGKTYSGPGACGATPAVSFTYDEFDGVSQFGKGRRTGMNDGSGNTAWVYDRRGRVTSETKTIGTGVYKTEWPGYDAADRVTEMIYPGSNSGGSGEPVAYTYNDQGLLDSMRGYEAYVDSSSYDEAGRLTGRVSQKHWPEEDDSIWITTYAYHPWNDANLGRLWTINTSGTGETGTETF